MRTCSVTRERLPRAEMLRLVADSQGHVHVDLDGGVPGRGAWVQPQQALFERLERDPGPLKRSLRRKRLHGAGLLAEVRHAVDQRLALHLQLCHRAGVVRSGSAALAACDDAAAIVTAGGRGIPDVVSGIPRFDLGVDAGKLGDMLGRGPRSALVLMPSRPTRQALRWLRWRVALGYGPG